MDGLNKKPEKQKEYFAYWNQSLKKTLYEKRVLTDLVVNSTWRNNAQIFQVPDTMPDAGFKHWQPVCHR